MNSISECVELSVEIQRRLDCKKVSKMAEMSTACSIYIAVYIHSGFTRRLHTAVYIAVYIHSDFTRRLHPAVYIAVYARMHVHGEDTPQFKAIVTLRNTAIMATACSCSYSILLVLYNAYEKKVFLVL